ncbi:MAG TPA: triose-phosphate isomerase family protein, partial [Candidatus Kapabacteria bacterium]|nr:triose-phosphate isomerase family protein [Candidatus Kapabacteria bacterium]
MKYIFGNWKMFLDYDESIALANEVKSLSYAPEKLQLTVFPNYLALHDIVQILKDTKIGVGAQTVSRRPQGAYTGAISAYLVKKIGCTHGLVGHSERRYIFHESDEDIHDKIEASFKVGLSPVLCVGETEEDLKEGKRQYRLKKQLMKALEGIEFTPSVPFFVAYEPVWAVSSGKPCNPA